MDVKIGYMYFLTNDFYEKANDPKLNDEFKGDTRPVYVIRKSDETGLYWVAPCSKQWEKYNRIINTRKNEQKPVDGIQLRKIFGINSVILLQDMFPVSEVYVKEAYTVRDKHVHIAKPSVVTEYEKISLAIEKDFRKYKADVTYRPDAISIERLLLAECKKT